MSSYSSPYYTSNIRDTMSQSKFLTGKAAFSPAELAGIASGELEARYAGEAKNRQTLLQERQQEAQEKSTAWNQSYYEKQMALKEQADKKQEQANTISGVGQVISGGMGIYTTGKQAGLWGTTATPASEVAANAAYTGIGSWGGTTALTATPAYSAFGAGMAPTAGYGLTGGTMATGLSVPPGTLYGTSAVAGTSAPTLTGAGTSGAGSSTSALGVAGGYIGSAGAGYTAGTWAGKQAGNKRITKQAASFGGLIKGESTQRKLGGAFAGAGAGFGAGAAIGSIVPGVGTIVGGVMGAVVGGVSGAAEQSVICTELNRQGLLPDKVLEYDSMYGNSIDKEAYYGYRLWADKVVKLMQKSKLFTKIVKPFGLAFAYESAHRINPEIKGNPLGKLMLFVGVPMCKLIYRLKQSRKEFCNGLSWSIR